MIFLLFILFFCTIYEKFFLNITLYLTKFRKCTKIYIRGMGDIMKSSCDFCMNYFYDEEYDCYMCAIDMDEDDVYYASGNNRRGCPYFRMGNEYTIVRKQN